MRAILWIGIVIASVLVAAAVVTAINEQQADAAEMSRRFIAQTTAMSDTDPVPGHSRHQLVIAVPPREDGQIWSGTVTWTSSTPLDVVVLHAYDPSTEIDERGEPLTAPSPFNDGEIAITLVRPDSGSPVPSGTLSFAGSALAFHTTDGTPFTVTYTVDALAKTPNQ
jgi:hypothetical protein